MLRMTKNKMCIDKVILLKAYSRRWTYNCVSRSGRERAGWCLLQLKKKKKKQEQKEKTKQTNKQTNKHDKQSNKT